MIYFQLRMLQLLHENRIHSQCFLEYRKGANVCVWGGGGGGGVWF